jgi:hypothetical protein
MFKRFLVGFLALSAALPAALPFFPFLPPWDDSSENAASAAFLNDHVAGSRGFITASGGHLANSAGRIRFWGTNTTFGASFPPAADARKVAQGLARRGFNVLRFHHMDSTSTPGGIFSDLAPDRTLDPGQLADMDRFVYELANAGIYSNFNLVVSRPFNPGSELNPEILQINDWKLRAVLGFFDPAQLALQKQYATDLLNHVNPYFGLANKDNPALAFIEINNENGLAGC